jgi:transposase
MIRLRDKMREDLELRGMSASTVTTYVCCARRFVEHFGLPPGKIGATDVRNYLLHLIHEVKAAPSTVNVYAGAIQFLYRVTLKRLDEPVAVQPETPRTTPVTGAAASRSIAPRLESSPRAGRRRGGEVTSLPPVAETTDTPTCSEAQDARRRGAQGRLVMRRIGLDLGVRHIAYCEVAQGKVVDRVTVKSLSELASRLGPDTEPAVVAFEACREGWFVHDTLKEWGHDPRMLDTTRVRQMGVGQHRRKNDPIDAEAIAMALDGGRIAEAHVLSPARRALRAQLSVRGALVETRAQYVTTIRGLARAAGVLLPTCDTASFVRKLDALEWDEATLSLVAPLVALLRTIEQELVGVEHTLAGLADQEPVLKLCATVPGVGLIVAATFVSVLDEAKRFKNAHAVGAYLGLVPSESTTGGPDKRKLGSITKQGNSMARTMLIQAAWTIFRSRDKSDPLKRWVEQVAGRRHKRVAVVALARKLAGVLWAMWRDGTVYDPRDHAEQSARGVRASAREQLGRAQALDRAAKKLARPATRAPVVSPKPRPKSSQRVAM